MNDLDDYLRGIPSPRLLELTAQIAAETEADDEVRWAYVRELQARPEAVVFEAVRAWCADLRSYRLRVLGADVLGQLGYRLRERPMMEDSQRRLAAMLEDDEPEVVAAAVTALSHFARNLQLSSVLTVSDHPAAEVRGALAVTLGGERAPEAIAALIALSQDEDDEVRSWATFGLGSQCDVDSPAVRQALLDRLDEPDDEIRGEALVGLARRGERRALAALQEAVAADVVGPLVVEAATTMPAPSLLAPLEALLARYPDDPALTEAIARCREAQ